MSKQSQPAPAAAAAEPRAAESLPRAIARLAGPLAITAGCIVLVVGSVLFWLAGQLSSVLSGHGWPKTSLADLPHLLHDWVRNPGEPGRAWAAVSAAMIGPAWLMLLLFVLLWIPLLVLGFRLGRFLLNWRRRRKFRIFRLGFASGNEIRQLLGAGAVIRKAGSVRPSYKGRRHIQPEEVGFYLGRDIRSRQKVYGSSEDVFIILAPPRQGKDVHFCAPYTIDAPGACIVTSTRADAFTTTYAMRAKLGKVLVFDPNDMTNWPERFRWSLVSGAENPRIATSRSVAVVTGAGFSTGGEGAYYTSAAISALRIYLHAAALGNKTMRDIVRWSTKPTNPEPISLLRQAESAGVAVKGWASALETLAHAHPVDVGSTWAKLVQALSCFSDPNVLAACSPAPDDVLDMKDFLSGRNTLYILGKEQKNGSVAPLVTAMLEDMFEQVRKVASRMPGSRLDPPLTVELNEAAHIAPLPNLPAYMGDSGGFSISLHVYLQSLSQARSRWGEHEAMIMWDNAAIRVIMGGAGNVDDLDDVSRLMGEVQSPTSKPTRDEGKRVLSPEEVRTLRFGTAVVVARAARPVEVELLPWWERKDGSVIAAGKAETEKRVYEYSDQLDSGDPLRRYIASQAGGEPFVPDEPVDAADEPAPVAPAPRPIRQPAGRPPARPAPAVTPAPTPVPAPAAAPAPAPGATPFALPGMPRSARATAVRTEGTADRPPRMDDNGDM